MNSAASRQLVMPPMPEMGRPAVSLSRAISDDHVEGNRFYRGAAIAAVAALAVNRRLWREIVEVNAR